MGNSMIILRTPAGKTPSGTFYTKRSGYFEDAGGRCDDFRCQSGRA
jgi:hypothetical protein